MTGFDNLFSKFKTKNNHHGDGTYDGEISREQKIVHLKFLEKELKDLRSEVWELRKELGIE